MHAGDVGDSGYVNDLVAAAVARFWRLAVIHNNAGDGRPGELAECTDATFDEMIRVNLNGTVYDMRAAIAVTREQGSGGSIINTASTSGLGHAVDRGSYGAPKAAVINLTRTRSVGVPPPRDTGQRDLPGPDRDPRAPAVRARSRALRVADPHAAPRSTRGHRGPRGLPGFRRVVVHLGAGDRRSRSTAG
jgi:hypothetical protein